MFNRFRILVVDDEKVIREGCYQVLSREDYEVKTIASGKDGVRLAKESSFDLILLDLKMPDMDGLEALYFFKEHDPEVVVIIITGYPDVETAVNAMKLGAYDYISKPFTPEELRLIVKRALEKRTLSLENKYLKEKLNVKNQSEQIIGKSEPMQRIYEMVRKIAPTDSTALVTGESGTGKELIAKAIHAHSLRKDNEFVAVDCGALVETLLESELFGHVKGSFTGATQTKHGSLELANGGTFFFDEVSNLSLNMQSKLLRVIQEREIKPVGSEKKIPIDIRIITATNQDLRDAINKKTFREDLFYRLSVFPIRLSPLRERKDDIPLLVEHFIEKHNKKKKKGAITVAEETMGLILKYPWPGNVRELENVMERALILTDDSVIVPGNLPSYIREQGRYKGDTSSLRPVTLKAMEKQHIEYVLGKTNWNKSKAARLLDIDRKTLHQKINIYSLAKD
jgi:DNA-binding NtrC family response regulator